MLFIASGIPIGLSAVLAIALTWRYMSISREAGLERELFYLKAAFFVAAFDIIVVKESMAFVYTCFIFLIVISGYFTSQFIAVDRNSRKETAKIWKTVLYFPSLLLGPVCLFLCVKGDQFLFWLWNKIINTLIYVATLPLYLLQLSDFDFQKFKAKEVKTLEDNGERLLPEPGDNGQTISEQAAAYVKWMFIALLLIALLYLVVRVLKRKHQVYDTTVSQLPRMHFEKEMKEKEAHKKFKHKLRQFALKPRHPVRRMMLAFEKGMREQKFGRKYSETVEEWLRRIGLDDQLEVYQKVRYGEKEVSKDEINELTSKLRLFKQKMKEGTKDEKNRKS
ncbi:DUF4129 domain-containing protein [Virgibacillus halophilus]|uniref:DUF4129 domain-containing protein n=1 Tax=Tigheibacillus halophilus TaxID=361280 RepID=A0ABU5C9G5_9BACI|nr:DUF4129 domain-containing protein [Virgibacillus halophilus]